ncbi:DEAD/DEAH box helicase [bacterium]|nr:DEAD/DEAH box helicase [bacterium]
MAFRNNNAPRGNSFRGRNNNSRFQGRGGGGRSRGRGRRNESFIDERKFINKAQPIEAEAPYVHSFEFSELLINDILKKNIASKGFNKPTPIQDQSIPHILAGKDILGIANTGTGKTAAFLIPLIEKVAKNPNEKVLIITPTRELAEQIGDELYLLTWDLRMSGAMCIGGASIGNQISQLRRNPQFIVGTPGRLKDLLDRKVLNLSNFKSIVLDEVDRMLDMGFINDIKYLIGFLAQERQSLFFSATMDHKIEEIVNMILKKDRVRVSVKKGETASHVDQDVIRVGSKEEKLAKLEELLRKDTFEKVLVFINMKWHVDKLEKELRTKGFKVESIHGDKRQSQRSRAIENFKSGRANILLATDVAARGLDISNITHVINFDVPNSYEDYVHRIGRTGRANKTGTALTFVPHRGQSY